MEVAYALLNPYSEVSPEGKLYVVGGDIDTLYGDFPFTVAQPLYLTVKVNFPQNEAGRQYRTRFQIIGPDGTMHLETGEEILDVPVGTLGRFSKVCFGIVIWGITFAVPGDYKIRIMLDGNEIKSIPLYLELSPSK